MTRNSSFFLYRFCNVPQQSQWVCPCNQSKSVAIGGVVQYRNLKQNKNISKFPIVSEFIFEHQFANFKGDKEALTIEDKNLIRIGYLDFPTNEQMIFDTSTDLKNKFARILQRRSFR